MPLDVYTHVGAWEGKEENAKKEVTDVNVIWSWFSFFFSCILEFDGAEVIELNDGKDACNKRVKGGQVCIEPFNDKDEGIYSCVAKIKGMNRDLEGKWDGK